MGVAAVVSNHYHSSWNVFVSKHFHNICCLPSIIWPLQEVPPSVKFLTHDLNWSMLAWQKYAFYRVFHLSSLITLCVIFLFSLSHKVVHLEVAVLSLTWPRSSLDFGNCILYLTALFIHRYMCHVFKPTVLNLFGDGIYKLYRSLQIASHKCHSWWWDYFWLLVKPPL